MTAAALRARGSGFRAVALAALLAANVSGCDSSAVYLGSDVTRDAAVVDAGGHKPKDAGRAETDASVLEPADASHASADAATDAGRGDAAATDAGNACADGFADCNGDPSDGCEVDVTSDAKHCGGCETTCTTRGFDTFGGHCVAGRCALTCETGMADCDADPSNGCEAFLWFDPSNCGACGTKCTNCNQGRCN